MNILEHRGGVLLVLGSAPFPRLRVPVPLFGSGVCAAFPSPAYDHIEEIIDLNELLVRNPADKLNLYFGRGTVRPASTGHRQTWAMRQNHLTPRYTPRLSDVPTARL